MSQQELLKTVVRTLDSAGIDYMMTGSIVSSMQGEPRSTHDIDLVVSIREADIEGFVRAFASPEFYLDAESVRRAIDERSMFNLIDLREGDKVNFRMLTDEAFDRSRFSRKKDEKVMGLRIKVSRPEDTILMKLRWARLSGGSEKQFTDALRVFEVQRRDLDLGYLDRWAVDLQVVDLWNRIQEEAEIL